MSKVKIKDKRKPRGDKLWGVGDIIMSNDNMYKVYETCAGDGDGYVLVSLIDDFCHFQVYDSLQELYNDYYETGDQVVDIDIIIK